jgi:hypothetical protein
LHWDDRIVDLDPDGLANCPPIGLSRFVAPAIHIFPERAGKFEGAFGKLYSAHEGRLAIKWDHYFRVYDRHFAQFQGRAVKFLELGVSQGGSLQIWRKYFG